MSTSASIEVTASLIGPFAHLRSMGVVWGFRVKLGAEEIIGGTQNQRDAWREARTMKARNKNFHRKMIPAPNGRPGNENKERKRTVDGIRKRAAPRRRV